MPHLEYAVRQSGPAYAHYLDSVPARSNEHLQMLHAQYSGNYVRDGTARHTEVREGVRFVQSSYLVRATICAQLDADFCAS